MEEEEEVEEAFNLKWTATRLRNVAISWVNSFPQPKAHKCL